jgi:hypothetical protein
MGPMPPICPGRSARCSRVASGIVRFTFPANPGGTAPASGPPGAGGPGSCGLAGLDLGPGGSAGPDPGSGGPAPGSVRSPARPPGEVPLGRESVPCRMSR